MPTAAELTAEWGKKSDELGAFLEKVDLTASPPQEQIDKFRELNAALADIGKKKDLALEVEGARAKSREIAAELAKPVGRPSFGNPAEAKDDPRTFGQAICSVIYTKDGGFIRDKELEVKDFSTAEFKTTMTTSGGFPPEARRSGRMELSVQVPLGFVDLLPVIPVSMGTYTYMQETTFTNNAAAIAEAGTYPESALAYTPQTATVTKIGTFIPVTEEQLSDTDGMQALIDNRLRLMVRQELEDEVLNSTGTSNEINGFLNQVTQAQAKGTDPTFDAVYKAMLQVRTTGQAEPDAIVMHPADFADIRLATTTDGVYIMGSPDQVGLERLFGVRVVMAQRLTQNTALVGDFGTHSALLTRWGLDVKISDSDGTDFIKDIFKMKARVRAGLAIFRASAFCKVTGV